jgi:hypothetical protein
MRPRRTTLLVAVTASLIAGCASSPPEPPAPAASVAPVEASPSPRASSPLEELTAALNKFKTTTYRYAVTGDYMRKQKYRAVGTHDPKTHRYTSTTVITGGRDAGTRKLILIGDDNYSTNGTPDEWVHADFTRMKPDNKYRIVDTKDPSGLLRLMVALTNVRRTGPNGFKGDAVVTSSPKIPNYLPLGAPRFRFTGAAVVSFTAATDAQGRVTSIRTEVETDKGVLQDTTTFSDFGRPVPITKPAGAGELVRSAYDK